MISKKLYELAFEFKKIKLWSKLYDSQVFAIELSGGEIAYCSVMGHNKEHFALAVYIGDKGWNSFLKCASDHDGFTESQYQELLYSQECLQVSFENKEMLSPEEIEGVKKYTEENGISLRGKNSWPQFMKYQKGFVPWPISEKNDKKILEEVFERILYIEDECGFKNLYLEDFYENFTIQKFSGVKQPLKMEKLQIADSIVDEFSAEFSISNELLDKISDSKKKRSLDCEIVMVPNPVQENKKDVPRCPYMMLAHTSQDKLLMNPMILNLEEQSSEMLTAFANSMLENGEIPSEISVRDIRTYKFLERFCEETEIKLVRKDDIPVLDEIYIDLCEHFGVGSRGNDSAQELMMAQMVQMLSEMPLNKLKALPKDMIKFAKSLIGTGILPSEVEIQLSNI